MISFETGDSEFIAVYFRGLGGAVNADGLTNNGNEEIRINSISINAVN